MTVHSSGEPIETVLARLRAAQPSETDPAQQAVLRHEIGLLEEGRGDEPAAVREQLAAFEAYTEFREPLEALIRLCRRNPADAELPRLLETLVEVATSPEQSARALWELAAYRQGIQGDHVAAMECLMSAVETEPKDAASWLELELLAARAGDAHTQIRALEARAEITTNPTWQGLLLIDVAKLCAEHGDMERATSVLDSVVAGEGGARFLSRLALESIAAQAEDTELWAHALEGQAELIAQSLDEPELGERAGIPRFMRRPEFAAEAWLRAAELRRRAGDAWGAVAALSGAAERLPSSDLVARLRMAAADASGDHAAALEVAREQLAAGATGRWAAALWLRVGQAGEQQGELGSALEAYGRALELDPASAPALTLRIDALAKGEDFEALARTLELGAAMVSTDAAKARAFVAVAQVWACRARNAVEAKRALAHAAGHGVSDAVCARLGRCFAAICGDAGWYQEASELLLRVCSSAAERNALWLDIARSRLRNGDVAEAIDALGMVGQAEEGVDPDPGALWLGRSLAAYAVGLGMSSIAAHRKPDAVRKLAEAEADPDFARGLYVVAALLAGRAGQLGEAATLLDTQLEREPRDVVLGLFLADLRRREGDPKAAASVLSRVAAACEEPEVAAALYLESGFLLWNAGAPREAIPAFELALEHAPIAARQALSWALRCVDADDLDARRRAVDMAEEAGGDAAAAALERLGLAVASKGSDSDTHAAIEQLEELAPTGDLLLAAALARLLWPATDAGREGVEAALAELEQLDGAAKALVRAERFRLARFEERDGAAALRAAQAWAEAEPSVAASLEWLASALASDDRAAEIDARRALSAHLEGTARAAAQASAASAALVDQPGMPQPLLARDTAIGRLMNLELGLPGCDTRRRATALRGVGQALGPGADTTAASLAAWSDLARGDHQAAQHSFRSITEQRPEEIVGWEGYRDASEKLGDFLGTGLANARLGSLCRDDGRAAAFWEAAGLTLLEHTEAHEDAEIALQRALERDPTRAVAFDKLFRRVRARNEDDRLLALIDQRLKVTSDDAELTKMYWERARVLRRKGDQNGALKSLKDVTLLEPDHVGALALAGEIHITRGEFADAAPLLARLATLGEAPDQQRLVSGVAAADLFEKKLGQPDKALEVLSALHKSKLSTPPVRERLARIAARVGNWTEATTILEQLMEERDSSEGRAEAARLAMAIHRDKLEEPAKAEAAVTRLLKEVPDDAEAMHLVLSGRLPDKLRARASSSALKTLLSKLSDKPFDVERVQLLADMAQAQDLPDMRRAVLGCLVALGRGTKKNRDALAELAARGAQVPQVVLDAAALLLIADPEEEGPLAELFGHLAPLVSEALGPSLESEGVGRKQRVESAGDPLRADVSRWMAALGLGAGFQLYVGGRDERGVKGVAGEEPALIVGTGVKAPLDGNARAAVAREVFALRRGSSAVLRFDDHTIASIVIAASIDAGLPVPEPPYAVYPEVSRAIRKAMNRKVRRLIVEPCQRVQQSKVDPHAWAAAARRSVDRMALIASGDASVVIDDIIGPADAPARRNLESNDRARRLLAFALSPGFLAVRKKFGMGIA